MENVNRYWIRVPIEVRPRSRGDVRAILVTYIGGHNRPIRRIKPSEWRATELDIRDDDLHNEEGNWVEVSSDDLEYWLEQEEPDAEPMPKHKRDEAIARRLKEEIVPGSTVPWKTWDDLIRKDIGAKATDVGCSNERIEKMTRATMRRPKGHIGQPNMTDVT
jgi:hypothetical protein